MKRILLLLAFLALAASAWAQNISVTLTFTPEQAAVLSNAVAEANLAATNAYTVTLQERLDENARLLAANPSAPTNALPSAPVVLTLETYVRSFAASALTTTQPRLDTELADEVRRRIGKLTSAELKALRQSLPNRR